MKPAIPHRGLKISGPAVGNLVEGNRLSVAIRFDLELFHTLRDRALRHRTSFASQARALIRAGLEATDNNELKLRRPK